MLISPDYLEQQRLLHDGAPEYGSRGFNWAYLVCGIAKLEDHRTVLDYGCGKGQLGLVLRNGGVDARDYDPAVAGFKDRPRPASLVCCVDVLEHVEPLCLDYVLADLKRLTERMLFVVISCRPASKSLCDGRNAHLIVAEPDWWRARLEEKPLNFKTRRVWATADSEWVALLAKR